MLKKWCVVWCVVTLFAGCGGGSSNDSQSRNISGTWTGSSTKVTDTCNTAGTVQTQSFTHRVSQNEDAVTLRTENNLEYLGNIVGGEGFSVDASVDSPAGVLGCQENRRIEYDNIVDDDDATAGVDYRIERTCPGSNKCEIAYTGTATRAVVTGSPTPAPTASPGATPVPSANAGCNAILENPAAGTYSGNGGCGISDVKYSVLDGQNVVVLSPFGANGATSFNVNAANQASAASVRTDLAVNGGAGYACTLTCSAPGTFTVRCIQEGGSTCTEKF